MHAAPNSAPDSTTDDRHDPIPHPSAEGVTDRPRALIGWRLLALCYDFWPALALWMLASLAFTLGFTATAHDTHQNIAPFSALQWLLWLVCWAITGLYATISWRRGGQTLGMRPWRLRMVGDRGAIPSWRALALRYAVGTLSLLLGGLGFWWAWRDRERRTWHDRASATHLIRSAKSRVTAIDPPSPDS